MPLVRCLASPGKKEAPPLDLAELSQYTRYTSIHEPAPEAHLALQGSVKWTFDSPLDSITVLFPAKEIVQVIHHRTQHLQVNLSCILSHRNRYITMP